MRYLVGQFDSYKEHGMRIDPNGISWKFFGKGRGGEIVLTGPTKVVISPDGAVGLDVGMDGKFMVIGSLNGRCPSYGGQKPESGPEGIK